MEATTTVSIKDTFPDLTLREREILAFSVQGMIAKEVAHLLLISPRTVEDHRMSIFRKTKSKNMTELAYQMFGKPKVLV